MVIRHNVSQILAIVVRLCHDWPPTVRGRDACDESGSDKAEVIIRGQHANRRERGGSVTLAVASLTTLKRVCTLHNMHSTGRLLE